MSQPPNNPKDGNWDNIVKSLSQVNSQRPSSNPNETELFSNQNNKANNENFKYSEVRTDMISYLAPFTQQFYLENSLKERENLCGSLMCATKDFLVYADSPNIIKAVSLYNLTINSELKLHENQVIEIAVYNENKTSVINPLSSIFKEKKVNLFGSIDNKGLLLIWYVTFSEEGGQIYQKTLMSTLLMENCKEIRMKFKTPFVFLTYFNQELSVWSLSQNHYEPINSKNLVNSGDQNQQEIPGPSKYLTHIFSNKIIDAEFSQKNDLIYVGLENNSISILNIERLDLIKSFVPYNGENENLIQILPFMNIFKSLQPVNKESPPKDFSLKDVFITISDNIKIKVWDLSELENKERNFGCIQVAKPPICDLKIEQNHPEKKFVMDFDFTRNFLFILFRQNKENIMLIYHIDTKFYEYNEETFKNQQNFFDFLKEFKLQESPIYQFQVINLYEQEYKLYFHTEEKVVFTVNALNEIQNEEIPKNNEICNSKTYFAIFCLYSDYFNINLVGSEAVYPIYLIEDLDKIEKNQENQNKNAENPANECEEKKENFPPPIPDFLIEMHNNNFMKEEKIENLCKNENENDNKNNTNNTMSNNNNNNNQNIINNNSIDENYFKEMYQKMGLATTQNFLNTQQTSFQFQQMMMPMNLNNPIAINNNIVDQHQITNIPYINNNNPNINANFNNNSRLQGPINKQKVVKKKQKKTRENQILSNEKHQKVIIAAENNLIDSDKIKNIEKELKGLSPNSEIISLTNNNPHYEELTNKLNNEEKFLLDNNEENNKAQTTQNKKNNEEENNKNNQIKDFDMFFEKFSSMIDNKMEHLKEEIEKNINQKFENLKSNKMINEDNNKHSMINENNESNFPKDLQIHFSKMFSEQFEKIVTPCFEKYLIKIFEQINNTFERGQKFFIDKVNIEQIKSQNIKDSLQETMKIFMQISNSLSESITNNKNNNKMDFIFNEKQAQVNKLLDNVSEIMKKEQEIQEKLGDIEKNFQNIVGNLKELGEHLKQGSKSEDETEKKNKANKEKNPSPSQNNDFSTNPLKSFTGISPQSQIIDQNYSDQRGQIPQNISPNSFNPYLSSYPQGFPYPPNQIYQPNILMSPNFQTSNLNPMEISKTQGLNLYQVNTPPSQINNVKYQGEMSNDPQKMQEINFNNLARIHLPICYPLAFNNYTQGAENTQQNQNNISQKPQNFNNIGNFASFNHPMNFPNQINPQNQQNFQENQKNMSFANFQYGAIPFLTPNNNNPNEIIMNAQNNNSNNQNLGGQPSGNINKQK